jgi:uncharacterized protein YegL
MTLSKATLLVLFIVMLAINVGIVGADEMKADLEGQSADYGYPENGPIAEVDYLNISTQINDGYSITTVEEKLDNKNSISMADKFEFLIPKKAFFSGFSIIIDGKEYKADILKKAEAQQKFEKATSSGRTAGLLETRDSELFSYSLNFKPKQSIIVRLTYEQALTRTLGEYEYLQPLRSNHDVKDLSVSVDIKSSTNVLGVKTPGFKSDVTYPHANSAQVRYTANALPAQDMKVIFETENTPLNGNMLFYENNDQGYFMHIFSPTAEEIGTSPLNKDIIFVIDKSGSMGGLKIKQVKTAFSQVIGDLSEGDRFNVVFFDSELKPFSSEILLANDANKDKAIATVTNVTADGGTNINAALTTSLGMFYNGSENVPIIVFLTDGMPTEGVTSTAAIRDNVLQANNVNASIFAIAFGEEYDYDFDFLQAISLQNRGTAVYFEPTSEAAAGISDFYETISTPLVSNLNFSYDGQVSQTVLTGRDNLFVGSEVITLGRYDPHTASIITRVNGNTRNGKHIFEHEFAKQPGDANNFVARLWAYNTIMNRLDRMKVEGETYELISEVTNLSLEYGFVTPYTSFFVEIPQAEEPEEKEKESTQEEPIQAEQTQQGQTQQEQTQSNADQSVPMGSSSNEPIEEPPMETNSKEGTPGFEFWLAAPALCGALLILRRARR